MRRIVPVAARRTVSIAARRIVANATVAALLAVAVRARGRSRLVAGVALAAVWGPTYRRERRRGRARTDHERRLLTTATSDVLRRHYDERVPTVEEELELWGAYHRHRHEMRYDLVAGLVRDHLPAGGIVLDVGCGSALLAERLADHLAAVDAVYVGLDVGAHHTTVAATRLHGSRFRGSVTRAAAEGLPLQSGAADVVVMSEVIEHLLEPDVAVWEVARVLRPGGTYVMTTNNASEAPLRSPLTHLPVWVERAAAASIPRLLSRRSWIWPEPVDPTLLPPGAPPTYVPHTHHIAAETCNLLAAAGLRTRRWSTFEFPPPQSVTARWLDRREEWGRHAVDVVEAVARRTPGLRRLGCHLLIVAHKVGPPAWPEPPPHVWPGRTPHA